MKHAVFIQPPCGWVLNEGVLFIETADRNGWLSVGVENAQAIQIAATAVIAAVVAVEELQLLDNGGIRYWVIE